MSKLIGSVIGLYILSVVLFIGCSKSDSDSANRTLKVKMTDAPGQWDEVNVDIQQVQVGFRNDTNDWHLLNTNAGIYDLLTLQNGIDTVLAVGTVPTNSVREIRFILGDSNTIKVGGVVYPLTIPSGASSGLKIKINKAIVGQIDSILIDFDAALSVHQTGTGEYMLKPVLKIK